MFKTTVGVRQGCLLSPVLFNLFLEEIMAGIQDEHISTISIGGRNLSNLRFADDIDLIAGSNDELQTLTNKLSSSASRYGMQISAEKSKIMINSNKRNLHSNIKLYGEKLEEVEQFIYLGATITKDGSSDSEIKIRLAQATSAMVRLTTIWNSKDIRFKLKYNLYRSLVLSILAYGCESWTISAISTKKLQGFENKSHRKLLGITYREMKTNEYIKGVMISLIGTYEPIVQSIRRRKLKWYGHTIRHDNLSKTILQGMVEGNRKCGRPKRKWIDDIKEWSKLNQSDLMVKPHDRNEWRRHCLTASSLISPTIRESRE